MKQRWQEWSARFAALQPREKAIIAAAVAVAIVMGGTSLWIDPAKQRLSTLEKQVAKDKADAQALQAQLALLRAQLKDPDEPNRKALAEVKTEAVGVEQALHQFDSVLVPPERAPRLLQSLLVRHRGLELVSLQTLPPAPLLGTPPAKADAKAGEAKGDAAKAEPKMPAKGENIQKHGIEIKIAGSYLDLLAYVAELEQLPHKLLWDSMSLTVQAYPKSELTLTVSTLSLDSIWLVF